MATSKKPTAKQLAARKLFAQRSRSGELAKERAHHQASGKRRVAKNPKRTKTQDIAIALSEQRAGHPRKAKEFFEKAAVAKNPAKKRARKIPVAQTRELHSYGDTVFIVEISEDKKLWEFIAARSSMVGAKSKAEKIASDYPGHYIRVVNAKVGA